LIALGLLAGLYLLQIRSYLLFHSLVEVFSIAVAAAVFMLAWNSRHFVESHFLLWIGIGYLFVALLDLIHTLTYTGMGVFEGLGTNTPTQLWIAARFIQAITLLAAPLFFERKLRANLTMVAYSAVTGLVLMSIFWWDIFPTAWTEAGGLTPFKITAEYVISALLLGSIAWILLWRRRLDRTVLALLVGSIAATFAGELAFTLYTDPYSFANLVGHFLKLVAFYLLYKAVVEAGLRRPYAGLFHDLKRRERDLATYQQELEALNETLEERVARRTQEARALARELTQAESRERQRLAEVLHDDLQQTLAAARMRVQTAANSPERAEEALQMADEYLGQAIERSRCLAVEVSPAIVRREGLGVALCWLGEHMEERHGLTVEVTAEDATDPSDPDVAALLFRIVRELLFNVTKHAEVDSAAVTACTTAGGDLCITVSDQGRGFPTDDLLTRPGHGFGLGSVRNRVEMLGGSCAIHSRPGEGTEVTVIVPPAAS
jgi:signal transduction histidine kinase